jgi:aspartate/methionine/tyrosine aminotransferase
VGVAPGLDFGEAGEGWLRFTYANSEANIQKALQRLGDALPRLK